MHLEGYSIAWCNYPSSVLLQIPEFNVICWSVNGFLLLASCWQDFFQRRSQTKFHEEANPWWHRGVVVKMAKFWSLAISQPKQEEAFSSSYLHVATPMTFSSTVKTIKLKRIIIIIRIHGLKFNRIITRITLYNVQKITFILQLICHMKSNMCCELWLCSQICPCPMSPSEPEVDTYSSTLVFWIPSYIEQQLIAWPQSMQTGVANFLNQEVRMQFLIERHEPHSGTWGGGRYPATE